MSDASQRSGAVHHATARKEWSCAECAVPIQKGERYLYLNTHDPVTHRWSRYILCERCERIRNCLRFAEIACETTDSYVAGRLRREVAERRLVDNDFDRHYQTAWLASEPLPEGS